MKQITLRLDENTSKIIESFQESLGFKTGAKALASIVLAHPSLVDETRRQAEEIAQLKRQVEELEIVVKALR